jgi:hypothetical protein
MEPRGRARQRCLELYRGVESGESLFEGPMKSNDPLVGSFSSYRIEQFHETRLIRIAHRTIAIWLNPFGMLDPEIVVNLLPKLGVGVDLMRSKRWLGDRFRCSAGRFVRFALSVSALPTETNKFHKRLSIWS